LTWVVMLTPRTNFKARPSASSEKDHIMLWNWSEVRSLEMVDGAGAHTSMTMKPYVRILNVRVRAYGVRWVVNWVAPIMWTLGIIGCQWAPAIALHPRMDDAADKPLSSLCCTCNHLRPLPSPSLIEPLVSEPLWMRAIREGGGSSR